MSDRVLTQAVRGIAVLGGILGLGGVFVFELFVDYDQAWLRDGYVLMILIAAFFGVFVWLVGKREPRNAVVWAMAVAGLGAGLYIGGYGLAPLLVDDPSLVLGDFYIPADAPAVPAWVIMVAVVGVYIALYVWLTFGILLFPDGKLPSRRWRWVAVLASVGLAVTEVGTVWDYRSWNTSPVSEDSPLVVVGAGLVTLAALLSMVALVVRFRRSSGVARDQFKWVAWGAAVMVPWFVAAFFAGGSEGAEAVVIPPLHLAVAVMLAAYGIALGKYRLYDVDVVISRTVTYALLLVVLALLYGSAIVAYILLFGDPQQRGGDLGLALPFGATVLVALLFAPLRARLQRLANRIALGKRAAPYELLSRLTGRLAETSTQSGLADLAELLRVGTGSDSAQVWVAVGGGLRFEAASPDGSAGPGHLSSVEALPSSELELALPVQHAEELLGAIGITKPRAHPVTRADRTLLADVAAGAGLLLRNLRLNAELAERASQVRASRRRLIEAHDTARHRLERDLHDGAQQQVVALKVRLGLAKALAEREGLPLIADRVDALGREVEEAIDAMRSIARGIYPPLLEAEGLAPALSAAARTTSIPLRVEADGLPRYPVQVEQTLYFCVMAAVTRAHQAGATYVDVTVTETGESVQVEIGYDAADTGEPTELTDRIEAFGGDVAVDSTSSRTAIAVRLPIVAEMAGAK